MRRFLRHAWWTLLMRECPHEQHSGGVRFRCALFQEHKGEHVFRGYLL